MIWRSPILGIPKLTQAKWAPKKGSNKQSVLLFQQDVMLLHLFGGWSAIVFATSHYHQWSTTIKPRLPLIIPLNLHFPCRSPASVHLSAPSASCHRRWSDAKPWRFSVADATQRQGTALEQMLLRLLRDGWSNGSETMAFTNRYPLVN